MRRKPRLKDFQIKDKIEEIWPNAIRLACDETTKLWVVAKLEWDQEDDHHIYPREFNYLVDRQEIASIIDRAGYTFSSKSLLNGLRVYCINRGKVSIEKLAKLRLKYSVESTATKQI